jgi:ribonuclease PH
MPLRDVTIQRDYLLHPAGSVLISMGNTRVLCTATIEIGAPYHCREKNQGWLTAEYSLLPGSTHTRNRREVSSGKISGRTAEIQRLIGRSLRSAVDLSLFPDYTIYVDCDVLQADGGTRTASITGSIVALHDAFSKMLAEGTITENPMKELLAAISVGIVDGEIVLDLNYELDCRADVDMNVVMSESGEFVEIQGTAENRRFSHSQLQDMLAEASAAISQLIQIQKDSFL